MNTTLLMMMLFFICVITASCAPTVSVVFAWMLWVCCYPYCLQWNICLYEWNLLSLEILSGCDQFYCELVPYMYFSYISKSTREIYVFFRTLVYHCVLLKGVLFSEKYCGYIRLHTSWKKSKWLCVTPLIYTSENLDSITIYIIVVKYNFVCGEFTEDSVI